MGERPVLHFSGVFNQGGSQPAPKVIKFDLERRVALFAPGIEVPLNPFMGIMIVTPPEGRLVSSRPPGALFYTGDAHAVQGDGEVKEHSMFKSRVTIHASRRSRRTA